MNVQNKNIQIYKLYKIQLSIHTNAIVFSIYL